MTLMHEFPHTMDCDGCASERRRSGSYQAVPPCEDAEPEPAQVVDLMAALEASLHQFHSPGERLCSLCRSDPASFVNEPEPPAKPHCLVCATQQDVDDARELALIQDVQRRHERLNSVQSIAMGHVRTERRSQDTQWGWPAPAGKQSEHLAGDSDLYKLGILMEEVGEVATALIEFDHSDHIYEELTQVAAVALAWMESMLEQGLVK